MQLSNELSKQIVLEIERLETFDDVANLLQYYKNYELKGAQLGRAFEKMFVAETGFSSSILMEDLEKYHHSFHTTNGGDWCRSNQSYLGRKYNIVREKRNNGIYSVKCDGFNKNTTITQDIRTDIVKMIKKQIPPHQREKKPG